MSLHVAGVLSRLRVFPISPSAFVFAVAALFILCSSAESWAQGIEYTGTGGRHIIRGRILFPSGRRVNIGLKIRLESSGFGDLSVLSDANGSFAFHSLLPGAYTVVVEGADNFETVRERVIIDSEGANSSRGTVLSGSARSYTVQIYLQPKRYITATAKPGVLNAALASVPKPALELYEKAIESARKGENNKAIEQLQGAIALYPDFGLALTEMGVLYMKLKQTDKALDALRAALKFSPEDFITLLTYGIALFDKKEFAEAEERLRQAMKKNNVSPSAHLYLGMTLIRRQNLEEAEKELRQAVANGGANMSLAHYYLGGLYWAKRDYDRAANELEMYLRLSPEAPDAGRVGATVKELRSKKH